MENKLLTVIFFLLITGHLCGQTENNRLGEAIESILQKLETETSASYQNVESFIVSLNGSIVFEKYYHGAHRDTLNHIQSQTKSVMALLIGISIQQELIANENQLVSPYFSSYFSSADDLKSAITIRDLLTMSSGMKWEEMIAWGDSVNDNRKMYMGGNWLDYTLSRTMAKEPFTEFKYNSGSPIVVGAIIQKLFMRRDGWRKIFGFLDKYFPATTGINTHFI